MAPKRHIVGHSRAGHPRTGTAGFQLKECTSQPVFEAFRIAMSSHKLLRPWHIANNKHSVLNADGIVRILLGVGVAGLSLFPGCSLRRASQFVHYWPPGHTLVKRLRSAARWAQKRSITNLKGRELLPRVGSGNHINILTRSKESTCGKTTAFLCRHCCNRLLSGPRPQPLPSPTRKPRGGLQIRANRHWIACITIVSHLASANAPRSRRICHAFQRHVCNRLWSS